MSVKKIRHLCCVAVLSLTGPAGCGSWQDEPRDLAGAPRAEAHPARPAHRFCGWIYPYEDPMIADLGYASFAAHAGEIDAVHPMWWRVASETTFTNRRREGGAPRPGFHDRRVLEHTTPGGERTLLVPTVAAVQPEESARAHRMIRDPELARRHVAALVALAVDNRYDGIDVDYEHLGALVGRAEGVRDERAAFTAFVRALADALHGRGKELTLSLPGETRDEGVYDYDALSAAADEIHIMGYDFHWAGGPEIGPLSPRGWLEAVSAYAASIAGGRRWDKFILGLPNYGLVGDREPAACEPTSTCTALFSGEYATTAEACVSGGAHFDPGRAPNQRLDNGDRVFFEDLLSLEEKVIVAERVGLGGVALFGFGGEPEGPGQRSLFEMVRSHFPKG